MKTTKLLYSNLDLNQVILEEQSKCKPFYLQLKIPRQDLTYDLILKPDTAAAKGTTQWFFFSCANTRKDKLYTINIINLIKSDSVYNIGLKLLMYSKLRAKDSSKILVIKANY